VEAFVKYVSPTPEEDEIRGFIVDLISNAVSKSFPDAKIMPFGSFETKLYLPTGYACLSPQGLALNNLLQ
jgi:non-canonical poly(A) RNA polymerase PAPD5/7